MKDGADLGLLALLDQLDLAQRGHRSPGLLARQLTRRLARDGLVHRRLRRRLRRLLLLGFALPKELLLLALGA